MDNQPKTDSAPPSPQGEKPNWHPPDPAPEGQSWKCPDCYSWVTLGENAWYHALRTGHGKPALESIPAPAPPAPHDTLREALRWLVNVGCGVGRAGGKPEDGELGVAIRAGQAALDAPTGGDEALRELVKIVEGNEGGVEAPGLNHIERESKRPGRFIARAYYELASRVISLSSRPTGGAAQVTPREDELRERITKVVESWVRTCKPCAHYQTFIVDDLCEAALSPREGAEQQEDDGWQTHDEQEGGERRKVPSVEAQSEAAQPKATIHCDHHEGQSTCPNCGQDVGVLRCKKTTTGQLSSKNYSPTPTVPPRRGRANRGVEEQECTSLVGTSYAPEISNRSQPVSQPATRVDRRVDEGSRPSQTGSRA